MLEKFLLGVWNVGIIENTAEKVISNPQNVKIRWMKHHYRDRFFADPFLLDVDENNYYILAEEFPFYDSIGYISLLTVDKKSMKLLNKKKWIEEPWHLSYPFVYNGRVIPEAYRSGKVYVYETHAKEVAKRETLCDMGLIDQTFLQYEGKEWIFATDADNALCGLKIFYRDTENKEWIPHKLNPVKEDIKTSRPGGHFFTIGETLYRPVQDSQERYGRLIRIMKVEELTPDTFKETEIACISADGCPPYSMGFHTFNVEKDFIVVDGYREYHSFFIKPMCLKLPAIMRFFGDKK